MKILIGTLHCGENEYEACCDSIRRQTHTDWDHFTVSHRPNKEAHDELYSKFMDRSDEFDLLMKIDADMVLCRDDFFTSVIRWMASHPGKDALQVLVLDYFSDRLIGGLNAFRSGVRWQRNEESVFVDDCPVPNEKRHTDSRLLAPAAYHCPNPSPFQSFHFGMHKGVKLIESMRQGEARFQFFGNHLENIERTFQNYTRTKIPLLGLACVGAELAIQGELTHDHVNYDNPHAASRLTEYAELGSAELHQEVQRLRKRSASVIPSRGWKLAKYRGRAQWRKTLSGIKSMIVGRNR